MTFEDFMLGLAAEAPKLHHHAIRLLLHLVAVSLKEATYTITATDREICTAVGIGRGHIGAAKEALRGLVQIETRPRQGSTFRLPSEWFPLQMSLGSIASGTERVPRLAPTGGQDWHRTGATAGTNGGPSGTEREPAWHQQGASVAPNGGYVGPEQVPGGTEQGPRLTGNQQDAGALRIESNRESVVIPLEVVTEIDRVLDTVEISAERWEEGAVLKQHIQTFMSQRGELAMARKTPPVEIVAKCLAVAPANQLIDVLAAVSQNPKVRPGSYIWFVVVFLDHCKNIPWKWTKLRMNERRQRKQPGRAEPLPFPAQMTNQLVSGVKRLK